MEKSSVYMTSSLKARLRAAARREGRPEAELLREAAELYLTRREARPASWGRFSRKASATASGRTGRRGEQSSDEAALDAGFAAYVERHR